MGLGFCGEKREAGGSWNVLVLQGVLKWVSYWDR